VTTEPKPGTARCPICERPLATREFQPFCSRRCADIDLGRWLKESYRVPAKEEEEAEEDGPPSKPKGADEQP
jgi:endogenous inhibitor of DNA gyrase (YacG/DUF329 family)